MKQKIARYHYTTGDYTCIHPQDAESVLALSAVRVSEYVEVEFTPRPEREIDAERRKSLEAEKERLRAQLAKLELSELAELGV